MARYHTPEEIRRYDLMKLGVLLLLLTLLFLTWIATRNQETAEVAEEPVGTATVESLDREEATVPVPTLGIPAINAPAVPPQPGTVPLSGTAGPGAQVVILVNGVPAAAAITGVDGNWSTSVDLPAGEYTVQAQTVDNVGAIVGESQPVVINVGGAVPPPGTAAINPPVFDPVTGMYTFTGTAAPGETVTITSNGMVVGTAVADETGAYSVSVIADAVAGDVQLQVADASGNIVQQSEPLKLGPRPPSLDPSSGLQFDPSDGAVVFPAQPEGLTLSGQGEPGTQVELVIDGTSTATAVVDAAGNWSLPAPLPEGTYTMQLNTLDPSGAVLSGSMPVTIVVGEVPDGEETAAATPESPVPTGVDTTTLPASEVLAASPDFSILLSVLESTGSITTLAEPGPFTIFAPTNEAFALLPQRVIDGLNANPTVLTNVLQYHITRGRYLVDDLRIVQPATVNDRLLTITPQGDTLLVNDALVTTPDIVTANGVIHAIDRILVPPLAEGVRLPVIDSSGVATFTGSFLTIVGTAEPNRTILVELNGEPFGQAATVGPDTNWSVSGDVTPGEYQIVAYMLGAADALEAISRPVMLQVNPE